jgi:hypothetical protein
MNRLWYQHNASQYKTHVRPTISNGAALPAGWEDRRNPEGRIFYLHSSGMSSWTKPDRKLPSGWKELKNPDGKSFFVHEEFQLCTWVCPGEQPSEHISPQMIQPPNQPKAFATGGKTPQSIVTNRRASTVAGGVGIAARLSTSASDIASDPFAGTTRAVTKGVMYAAKSLKNNKKTRKMLSRVGIKGMKQIAEAAITAGGDGDDVDIGDDEDNDDGGDDGGVGCSESPNVDYSNNDCGANQIGQNGDGYASQEVNYDPGCMEPQAASMYTDPFMQQGSSTDPCGQNSNGLDHYQEAQPSAVNNITIVENSENCIDQSANSQFIDQTSQNYSDQGVSNQYVDQSSQNHAEQSSNDPVTNQSTQNYIDNGQYITNTDAQETEVANTDVINVENNAWNNVNSETSGGGFAPMPCSTAIDPGQGYPPLQPVPDPCSTSYLPTDVGQPGTAEQQAPAPFIFEPMLAAPMMAEPPAGSEGVIFAPQYALGYDSSAALELI